MLDMRVGMNMIGDMNRYTQYQVANSKPIAAANEGGIAGIGAGLSAGMVMGQQMMNAMRPQGPAPETPPPAAPPVVPAGGSGGGPTAGTETKFCVECGKSIPKRAKFCPECGGAQ